MYTISLICENIVCLNIAQLNIASNFIFMYSSANKIKLKNNTTYTNTMTKSCKYRVYLDWVYNMYSLIVRQAYDQTIIFNSLWCNHFIYKCHSSLPQLIMYLESALPCTHQLTLSHAPTYSDRIAHGTEHTIKQMRSHIISE